MQLEINGLLVFKGERCILDRVSFEYHSPSVLCILGRNGSGKSTLLRAIMGEERMTHGEVLIDGVSVGRMSSKVRARHIAYISQYHHPVYGFSCLDVVCMGRTAYLGRWSTPSLADVKIAQDCLDRLNIAHLANQDYTHVSGGERQLVLLAAAIAQQASFLLLDEPTSALDYGNQISFLSLVSQLSAEGIGVILTTHNPNHPLFLHSDVLLLHQRSVLAHGSSLLLHERCLEQLYGISVEIIEKNGCRVVMPRHNEGLSLP